MNAAMWKHILDFLFQNRVVGASISRLSVIEIPPKILDQSRAQNGDVD